MAEVKLAKPAYSLATGIRKPSSLDAIMTMNIAEMIQAVKADNFKLVSNAEGTRFLHLENTGNSEYFSVKVGKKVTSTKRGVDLVKDLVENHTIYTGNTENGVWFTFGPEPTANEPIVEVSMADLIAKNVKFYAGS